MIRRWLAWWLCVALALGGAVGALATRERREEDTRGWVDATATLALPQRLPLAGVNVELRQYAPDELAAQLERIAAAGFTWVRQPFLWQAIEPQPGEFTWDAYDALVDAVAAQPGLQLVAVLDGAPAWARDELAPEHPYAPPRSVAEYGAFAGAVAARYAASITYYQIWDEPNLTTHWGNLDPRPARYVALLRAAYSAIHAADPTASVLAAALAPTTESGPDNLGDVQYLRAIYDLGGGETFDAAAGKPYGFDTGPDDRRVDRDLLNFARLILLREEMVRRGDAAKPLWGSNFGWNALPAGWTGPPSIWGSVSAVQQADYTRRAYARARDEWPWVGGLILQHWDPAAPADDPIQGFAVADRIGAWGALFAADGLIPGRYPAQNAHTTYSAGWQFSDLGADAAPPAEGVNPATVENRIDVTFKGTALALILHRGDYLAYLTVEVGGEPAPALPRNRQGEAFVVLTSPTRAPETVLIRVADDLPPGAHSATILQRPAQGDDRWPIAGFAVGVAPDTSATDRALWVCALVGGLALLGVVGIGLRLPWASLTVPAPATFRHFLAWLASLAASGIVLVGALLAWGGAVPDVLRRDPPALALTLITAGVAALSPPLVVTLAALAVLFVLIYHRPLLGLMLIVFWSAFFLSTLDLLFDAFATVEVYAGLTVAALALRAAVEWGRARRGEAAALPFRQPRWNALDVAVLAFVLLGALSLSWAEFRGPALRFFRVVMLEPAAFYLLLRVLRLGRRDWLWLVDTLLFTGAAIAVVGFWLYFTGQSVVEAEGGARRLISVYGSPNGVGLYLGRCLPFALAFLLLTERGSWRWLYAAASGLLMLGALLLSQSRGAILLGLPAALVAVLIAWRGRAALRLVVITLILFAVILIPLSLALPRLGDLLGETATFRRHLWASSWQLIREHPLTGAGLDQFLYAYRSRYLLPEAWAEPDLSIPHNLLLNHWVNLGILGVAALIGLQALFWRTLAAARRRARDPIALALVIGLAGSMADFLAHGLVDVAYFAINLAFVFFLSLALAQWLRREEIRP